MFRTHRKNLSVLTIVALGLSSLLATAQANPLQALNAGLWPRASRGTKHVGSPCENDAECYSANCYYIDGDDVRRCHFQSPNRPCFENANCVSKNCTAGYCGFSPINGRCNVVYDCADYSQLNKVCDQNKCKVNVGFNCTSDAQCQTGHCFSGTCGRTPQWPNYACENDSECVAGSKCAVLDSCADDNGKDTGCSPGWRHCTRLALGGKCHNDGDCGEGFCRSGICTASKVGDPCVSETQCSSPAVCSPTNKCHIPGNSTLYPQEICKTDGQCYSKRCVADLDVTDQYDVDLPYLDELPEYTRCDYLKIGEGKCRTYVDCASGICKNDKCALGKNGDRCLYNSHCENVCSMDGKCYSPSSNGTLAVGQPCVKGAQCFSGKCDTDDVERPLPYSPNVTHHVIDNVCYQADAGGRCMVDSDCQGSACRDGKCTVLGVGETCSFGYQCNTGDCSTLGLPSNSSQPVCILVPAGGDCYYDRSEICYSRSCVEQPCPNGGECGPTFACDPQPTLGDCRFNEDCRAGQAVCDAKDKKCRLKEGKKCKTNDQCRSRTCLAGKCVAASSTSTISTTSRSSSTGMTSTKTSKSSTTHTSSPTGSTSSSSKSSRSSPSSTPTKSL